MFAEISPLQVSRSGNIGDTAAVETPLKETAEQGGGRMSPARAPAGEEDKVARTTGASLAPEADMIKTSEPLVKEISGEEMPIIDLDSPDKLTLSSEVSTAGLGIPLAVEDNAQVPADLPRPEADVLAEGETHSLTGSSKRIEKLPIKRKLIKDAPDAIGEIPPTGPDSKVSEALASEKTLTGEASLLDEVLVEKEADFDSSSDYEFNEEYAGVLDKTGGFTDKTGGRKFLPEGDVPSGNVFADDLEAAGDRPEGLGQEMEVPGHLADAIASRQEVNTCINTFLTSHLTGKWSVESYGKSVSASIQRSKDHSSKIEDMQRVITEQAEKMNSLEALVKSQAEMIKKLDRALDDSYKSYTELSERVDRQGSDILRVSDTSDWNNGEIFGLCSENVDDRNKQSLINTSLQSRLTVLEEIRKIDHFQAGTISNSEVNSLKMEGWQALAAYLAARGDFPRYLLNDEKFTPLLRDKDEILWLLSEYDTRAAARHFRSSQRYQGGNQRGDASSSRPAQDSRPKDGPGGR